MNTLNRMHAEPSFLPGSADFRLDLLFSDPENELKGKVKPSQ
jgi:hypothetical protein